MYDITVCFFEVRSSAIVMGLLGFIVMVERVLVDGEGIRSDLLVGVYGMGK